MVENRGSLPECEFSRLVSHRTTSISEMIASTELECSVKGYEAAIFRSCSSVTTGNITFQLFGQRLTQMFAGPNPFPTLDGSVPQPERVDDSHETMPPAQPTTSVPAIQKRSQPLSIPQVSEPSSSASKRNASGSSLSQSLRKYKVSRPGDGWYVAYNAVLPGVCYGA